MKKATKATNTKAEVIQEKDVENLVDALTSVPKDKFTIMAAMAETFISGMKAQERLMISSKSKTTARERRA